MGGNQVKVAQSDGPRGHSRDNGYNAYEGSGRREPNNRAPVQRRRTCGETRGIRFRSGAAPRELEQRARETRRFLEAGYRVQVTVRFCSQERSQRELGEQQIEHLKTHVRNVAAVARAPKMEGRSMTLILVPR